jgi:AAA domain-containing protein
MMACGQKGTRHSIEQGRPRWHNPSEVEAVIDVLRRVKPRRGAARPSLAILSPYKAQVDLLDRRVAALRGSELSHLGMFEAVRSGGGFVGTVDSFQGSEADLVIVSLVRNNPRAGGAALGFLRDRRRINVALSRAKWQLVLVGSLDFLKEAVRGVNPDDEPHDLSFLTQIAETIETLAGETRGKDKLPLATIIPPAALGARL